MGQKEYMVSFCTFPQFSCEPETTLKKMKSINYKKDMSKWLGSTIMNKYEMVPDTLTELLLREKKDKFMVFLFSWL